MGQVATVHDLTSEDTAYNYAHLAAEMQSRVPSGIKVVRTEIIPLAFGLSTLQVTCIMQDAEDIIEKLEDFFRSIDGISNVETKELGLI
jgi:translation elongation factor aEF-1 beta